MINLYEALKRVLLTESLGNDIANAINNKLVLDIYYDDTINASDAEINSRPVGHNPTGKRTIYPYCYGISAETNKPALRAFQISNNSRRITPGWKLFRLDRIVSLIPRKQKFNLTPRELGYPNAPEYNQNGDGLMSQIFCQVKIDKDNRLDAEKAKTDFIKNAPKINSKNIDGPIPFANQQRKKNVFTSQPNSKKYKEYAKNVIDANNDSFNRFDDDIWKQAEKERALQKDVPKPENNQTKPLSRQGEEEDDEYNWLNNKNSNNNW